MGTGEGQGPPRGSQQQVPDRVPRNQRRTLSSVAEKEDKASDTANISVVNFVHCPSIKIKN